MKVTCLETHICHAYRTNWVFVRVYTDDGVYGVGEATLEYKELAVVAALKELEPLLQRTDPRNIERFWHDAYRDSYWRSGPVLSSALSAVEMALWDIKGKLLGVPVYELLGGKVRDHVPCYANGWFAPAKTPEEFAEKARLAVDKGYAALKWDPFGAAWLTLSRRELTRALDCVAAVKDAVGDAADIIIEGHGRFDVPTALRVAQALAPFGPLWFEEPLPPEHLEGLAELKRRVAVPISAGERLSSRWQSRTLFEIGAADLVQPDVSHAGGIGELKRIADMAEVRHLAFCPHNPSGPVANAATLQLAACCPTFWLLETMSTDVPWRKEICTESVRFENGGMSIPDAPGLGVDIVPEAIEKYPYERRELRHFRGDLTDIRPPDAEDYA
jgi:galactonate dehydratase